MSSAPSQVWQTLHQTEGTSGGQVKRDRSSGSHFFWRIGDFLTPQEDKWWVLCGESDAKAAIQEVTRILGDVALPYLEKHSRLSELFVTLSAGNGPPMSTKQRNDLLVEMKMLIASG